MSKGKKIKMVNSVPDLMIGMEWIEQGWFMGEEEKDEKYLIDKDSGNAVGKMCESCGKYYPSLTGLGILVAYGLERFESDKVIIECCTCEIARPMRISLKQASYRRDQNKVMVEWEYS